MIGSNHGNGHVTWDIFREHHCTGTAAKRCTSAQHYLHCSDPWSGCIAIIVICMYMTCTTVIWLRTNEVTSTKRVSLLFLKLFSCWNDYCAQKKIIQSHIELQQAYRNHNIILAHHSARQCSNQWPLSSALTCKWGKLIKPCKNYKTMQNL